MEGGQRAVFGLELFKLEFALEFGLELGQEGGGGLVG